MLYYLLELPVRRVSLSSEFRYRPDLRILKPIIIYRMMNNFVEALYGFMGSLAASRNIIFPFFPQRNPPTVCL